MGKTLILAFALLIPSVAAAQPGQTPYPPQPQPYPPAPQPQQPAQVTPEEYKLLLKGEMTPGQHIGGGLLGTFVGFGSGHLVQERWGDKGWIFTVGEVASYGFLIAGIIDCAEESFEDQCNEGYIWGGLIGFVVFRIWELIDIWAYPPEHNRKVRELRARVYGPNYYYQQPPPPPPVYLRAVDGGYTAGFTLRF